MNSEWKNHDPPEEQPDTKESIPSCTGVSATLQDFENLVSALVKPSYLFRLFVSGTSPRSATAITNVRRILEEYLPGQFELEVIDVYQQSSETKQAQVIAVPTLIKELPLPPQRFVGDMSNTDKIVISLNLKH